MNKIIAKSRCYIMGLFVQPIVRLITLFIPLREHKYMCISMNGNNYGDNIKCLADYISYKDKNASVIWAFNYENLPNLKCEYKHVRLFSIYYYYHLQTSKYILINFAMDFSYLSHKRKGQICLETWHGTALKRIGYDMYKTERPDILYRWFGVDRIKNTVNLADIWLSGSYFMTKIFNNSFSRTENLYEIGTPRNDIFFQNKPDVLKKVKSYFGIEHDTGIILYAPTFRVDRKFTYYDIDLDTIRKIWGKKTHIKYALLVRLHPVMLKMEKKFSEMFPYEIYNASLYPDMQELLYCADMLITDYSSSIFDFMYLKRPIIMYIPDKDTYSRGFYWDIDSLPFMILNKNSEIISCLDNYDTEKYKKSVEAFITKIGSVETGHATENAYKILTSSKY